MALLVGLFVGIAFSRIDLISAATIRSCVDGFSNSSSRNAWGARFEREEAPGQPAVMVLPSDEGTTIDTMKEWVTASLKGSMLGTERFCVMRARFQEGDSPLGWQVRFRTVPQTVCGAFFLRTAGEYVECGTEIITFQVRAPRTIFERFKRRGDFPESSTQLHQDRKQQLGLQIVQESVRCQQISYQHVILVLWEALQGFVRF